MNKLNFKIQNLDKVKTLIELLNNHKSELPQGLVHQLNELADCDVFEYDADYFKSNGFGIVHVHADGYEIKKAMSINPILKRIKVIGEKDIYFQFCNITHEGSSILTIGDQLKDKVLMPLEPTEAMIIAAAGKDYSLEDKQLVTKEYKAMLATLTSK